MGHGSLISVMETATAGAMETQPHRPRSVRIGSVTFGNHLPLCLIAGPCQIESRDHALMMAANLRRMCIDANIGFVFKSSFDKANRTSLNGLRGVGFARGLSILDDVRRECGVPVLTDVHEPWQCEHVAEVVDCLQIPALLCRQTDLLVAAAKTGKPVNIKKGQFMAPADMKHVVRKVVDSGNDAILLTERGTIFGYNLLVNDMRSLAIMKESGHAVVFDATHSAQLPGGGSSSGGLREYVLCLAKSATAIGLAAVFVETHQAVDEAPSDGPCMIPLAEMPALIAQLQKIDQAVKS